MSKKIGLPRLGEQHLKFAHLRYKIVPIVMVGNEESDIDQFFDELDLPRTKAFSTFEGDFVDLAMFPLGGITAAFKINPDTMISDVGVAKCNISDIFIKAEGRMRSQGRFLKQSPSSKNSRFDTFVSLDISEEIQEDVPPTSTVRDCLIREAETVKEVQSDMAVIRSWAALKTSVPFVVEIS